MKKSARTPEQQLAAAKIPEDAWPYELPEGWTWVRLGGICQLINGKAFKPKDWSEKGLPIVRIQNLNNNAAPYHFYEGEVEEKFLLHHGDLLFAWSGTPGTSFGAHIWQGGDAVLNQHIFRIEFDKQLLDKKFFQFAMNQQLTMLIQKAHGGAGLQHVTKKVFEATPICVPPLAVQKNLVRRIESLFSKLDVVAKKIDAADAAFVVQKNALLHAAFSGTLTEAWRKKNGRDISWTKTVLKNILKEIRYGTSEKSDEKNQGLPVIRIPNVVSGELDFSDLKFLARDTADEKEYLRPGDILMVRSNGSKDIVGKSALVRELPQPMVYASFLIRVRPDTEKVLPEFLLLFLNSLDARRQFFAKAKSSVGINNINSKEIGATTLPLPTLPEQREIARQLDALLGRVARARAAVGEARTQVKTLRTSILARAFRGTL